MCSITFFTKPPSDKHRVSYYLSCGRPTPKGLTQIYNALPQTGTTLQGSAKAVFLLGNPRWALSKQIQQDKGAASKWLSTVSITGSKDPKFCTCCLNLQFSFLTEQKCLKSFKKNWSNEGTNWVGFFFVCLFVCFKTVSCFLLQTHNVFCFNRITCGEGKEADFYWRRIMCCQKTLWQDLSC